MCMLRCFHIHPVRSSCPGGWDYSAQKNPSGCVCSTQSKQVPRSPPGRAECTDCCLVAQSVPRIGQSQRPLLRREEQFLHTGPHWLLRTQRHLVTDWDVRLLHPVLPCLPHGGSEGRMDKKGLRVRNSPTCTLSQNGYGDCLTSNSELAAQLLALQPQPTALIFLRAPSGVVKRPPTFPERGMRRERRIPRKPVHSFAQAQR